MWCLSIYAREFDRFGINRGGTVALRVIDEIKKKKTVAVPFSFLFLLSLLPLGKPTDTTIPIAVFIPLPPGVPASSADIPPRLHAVPRLVPLAFEARGRMAGRHGRFQFQVGQPQL